MLLNNDRLQFVKLAEYISRNTTVERFCKATGIHKTTYYRLIYRQCVPQLATCRRIVEITGGYITYDDLLNETQFEREGYSLEELL